MITINATVFVKESAVQEYLKLAKQLIDGTRTEGGNLRYDMYQSVEQAGTFMFVEQYVDQAGLDAHHEAVHFTTFLKDVDPLLNGEMDVKVFRELPKDA
ncbi:putative quinol monooxygenase [Furfurilactobacillus siliginis]|uniref:ABM domain-containing protein n=1 Tax=Furfurilactobacillus siliginis TaxID=348151 RepID=A0A0R2L668_9LACO|nr:putative quinol monooxygenase [Furfurilactobacillus siliginis]KRN97295.1 hypothetical protein IV55_GL000223 [Furfurilactobacillus siliginis]GEK28607.1 hypothetical protein LSI01_09180 [Furfurilactobacillus siliginis]